MFNSELIKIIEDSEIQEYFKINKISIYDFVKKYIKIDRILNISDVDQNSINNKIDEVQRNILSKIECMKNENKSNDEIKTCIDNLTYKINKDIINIDLVKHIKDTFENNHKLIKIEETLDSMNQNFSCNSAKKGQITENILINLLRESLPDTEVIDTSNKANSGDIHLIRETFPTILIDSKNFGNNTVPKRDIDKFYRDIQENNCSGILCNTFGGIANKQHFEVDIIDSNIIVFLHSHKFDESLFKLAINIIYNMHSKLKSDQGSSNDIIINSLAFDNLKIEYNHYLQTLKHHLDIIRTNINSLSQLSFTLLDAFFKRKGLPSTSEKKPYTCGICAVSLSTEKILKVHIKKKHPDMVF